MKRLVRAGEWLLWGKVAEQWMDVLAIGVCLFALVYFGWHVYRAMEYLV